MQSISKLLLTATLCLSASVMYSAENLDSSHDQIKKQCDDNPKKGGLYIAGTGMWAIPSETGLGTFTDSWQYQDSDGGITARSKPSKADYNGSWGVKAGYDFSSSQNNVEVSYFRLHNSKHNVNDTSDHPISFGSSFFNLGVPLSPGQVFVSDAYLKYTLDQADAKFGRWFTFCKGDFRLLPSIGVRYYDLKHDLTFLVGHVRSYYWGLGPMVGLNCEYEFCKGFFLSGRFNSAIVMGNVTSNSLLTFGGINRYKSPYTNRITYSVDGSLGLAYKYTFSNEWSLQLEAGYRVAEYIGPLDIIQGFVSPVPRIDTLGTTNFGYSGPFFELTFHM